MEGAGRAAAGLSQISINGKKYWMSPLDLTALGTIEMEIMKARPNPMKLVAELEGQVSEAVFNRMMDRAYREAKAENKVTNEEFNTFLQTLEGMCLSIYLSLKPNHPELDLDEIKKELEIAAGDSIKEDELKSAAAEAVGIDSMGNSTGPTSTEAMGATTT